MGVGKIRALGETEVNFRCEVAGMLLDTMDATTVYAKHPVSFYV